MRKVSKALLIYLGILILFLSVLQNSYSEGKPQSITILFTHDMHDHFYPLKIEEDGEIKTVGGYARLYTAINEGKKRTLIYY